MKNSKNLVVLLMLTLTILFTQESYAQEIAYIQSDLIVPEMPAYKKAKSEIEAYSKQLQKKLEKTQAELQAYYQEVMDSVKKGLMTPKQQQEAEAKYRQMELDLQKDVTEADKQLAKKEGELTEPIYVALNKAIEKIAQENKYSYVLDKKFLLYSAGGIDATEKVKTALGISW